MQDKIALIYSKKRPGTIGIYFERALTALSIPFDHFASELMDEIPAQYALYFRIADPYVEKVMPAHLKPAIYWTSDVHLEGSLRHLKKQVGQYDFITCCLPMGVPILKSYAKKIFYISCGCDPEIHDRRHLPKVYGTCIVYRYSHYL